jgi:ABC-2 type transport system ATP-binding protein
MEIRVQHLDKTYLGGVQALQDINLEIDSGMFGLLGPNGAGKTTLMRILATLLKPTRGRATVDGFDVSDRTAKWVVKEILGYLPQELGLYPSLTVTEFLEYIAALKNQHNACLRAADAQRVVELVGLKNEAGKRIRTLSGGMKRRVGIAQALLGDPKLLIVDEPTSGLDPEERVRFRTLLSGLAENRIVILSTHIVEDIAATCRDMAVLREGQVIFKGRPGDLIASTGVTWELELSLEAKPHPNWQIASRVLEQDCIRLRIVGKKPHPEARQVPATLEEAYLMLMRGG